MKNTKEMNKGITLIALVITIILLLILAGITITQLTGSGLFGKAKLAQEEYKKAQAQEELELILIDIKFKLISEKGNYTLEDVEKELRKNEEIEIGKLDTENQKIIGSYKGYEFYVDADFAIHIEEKSSINLNVKILTEGYSYTEDGIEIEVIATDKGRNVILQHEENDSIIISEDISQDHKKYIIYKNGTYKFTASNGKNTKTENVTIKSILEEPQIEITNNNTGTSFTINVVNEYANDMQFVYYLNGNIVQENSSKICNVDNLNVSTSYVVKVAIKYNDTEILQKETTVITSAKPEMPKIILYKSNDEMIKEYQTLTRTGIEERTEIETNEEVILELKNSNSKILDNYYSLDGGITWTKYTDKVNVSYTGYGKIQAKQVNKQNGVESSVRIFRIIDTILDEKCYDR